MASSDEEKEASFSCFAKDFSPNVFDIKWLKDDEEISNKLYEIKTASKETKTANGTLLYSAASFLMVQTSEWIESNKFSCEFKGQGEHGDTFVNASVINGPISRE